MLLVHLFFSVRANKFVFPRKVVYFSLNENYDFYVKNAIKIWEAKVLI